MKRRERWMVGLGSGNIVQVGEQRAPNNESLEINAGSFGAEEGVINWLSTSARAQGTEVRDAKQGSIQGTGIGAAGAQLTCEARVAHLCFVVFLGTL